MKSTKLNFMRNKIDTPRDKVAPKVEIASSQSMLKSKGNNFTEIFWFRQQVWTACIH